MTRATAAVIALGAALTAPGCGSDDSAASHAADAEAGAMQDAASVADASDPEAEPASDPRRTRRFRCPSVPPTSLQARFAEKRLSAGLFHTCGIRDDGTLACWGTSKDDVVDVPPTGTFVRVAAGSWHTCGIRTSGEVACWGCDLEECGQSKPPPGTFIEIAAGDDITCGLRPDFTIECWGKVPDPGPPCGQFVQMDTWYGGCAVDASGHLECWPWDPAPDGGLRSTYAPRDRVKQVSMAERCECYLYENNEADCWTYQAGLLPWQYQQPKHTFTSVAAVFCGYEGACALREDGTVACTGGGTMSGTFTDLTCGQYFCCGMRTDGTAMCSGSGMPPNFPGGP